MNTSSPHVIKNCINGLAPHCRERLCPRSASVWTLWCDQQVVHSLQTFSTNSVDPCPETFTCFKMYQCQEVFMGSGPSDWIWWVVTSPKVFWSCIFASDKKCLLWSSFESFRFRLFSNQQWNFGSETKSTLHWSLWIVGWTVFILLSRWKQLCWGQLSPDDP